MNAKEFVKRLFEIGMVQRKFDFDYSIQKHKNFKIDILKTININDDNYIILNIRSGRYQILAVKNAHGIICTYKHSLRDCINWIKMYSIMDDIITNSYIELMDCKFDDYADSKTVDTIEFNFDSVGNTLTDSSRVQDMLFKNRIASNSCYGLTGYNLFKDFGDINKMKKLKEFNEVFFMENN